MRFLALAFLYLSTLPSASAAKCCNTPTIWTFHNTAKSPINLTCSLDSSSAAPAKPVTLATGVIASGSKYEHNWGPNWDNDGMGMIPGKWTCQNTESKNRAANSKAVTFSTDWGENVVVTWKDTEPTVAKADLPKEGTPTKAKN